MPGMRQASALSDESAGIGAGVKAAEALEILGSSVCRACGAPKDARFAFCRECYYALPAELRRNLWKPLWKGFDEAYAEAARFLERKVGAKP